MTSNFNTKQKNIIRTIFVNIFISSFIIMCYFYISELFGSVSTFYLTNNKVLVQFGFTFLVFSFFCILAGSFHGLFTGFIGEYLYQLAFSDIIYFEWCFIVGLWGFLCGLYNYKPLKYQDKKHIFYSMCMLFINSLLIIVVFLVFYQISILNVRNLKYSILILISNFFFQSLFTVIILIPISLFLYDKALATKERHLYFIILTHHPIYMNDHTFFLTFGKTHIYFCSRCSGVIIGGTFANFFTHLIEKIYNSGFNSELAVILCIILPIPGLIDWGTQRMLFRKSTTKLRLLTGFIIGSALHFLSFTYKYYFFMIFILTLYFCILGSLLYFGHKREMKLSKEDSKEMYIQER